MLVFRRNCSLFGIPRVFRDFRSSFDQGLEQLDSGVVGCHSSAAIGIGGERPQLIRDTCTVLQIGSSNTIMAGKGKKGGRGGTKYVHNHTYNPTARESDERKIERLHNMEVKRYQNCVDRNMKVITQYLPLETIAYKKQKIGRLISVS
jgi:hypothetical protein